jgi:hypothetical protein
LENDVAISPDNLLELKFLFIIMKEEKVIAIVLNSIKMKVSFSFGSNYKKKTGHIKGVSSIVPISRIVFFRCFEPKL